MEKAVVTIISIWALCLALAFAINGYYLHGFMAMLTAGIPALLYVKG